MKNFYSLYSVIQNEMYYHGSQRLAMLNYLTDINKNHIIDAYKNSPPGRYKLYNSDQAKVVIWRMEPYFTIPMHNHELKCAFKICNGRIRENVSKNGVYNCNVYTDGELGFINKNVKHSIINTSDVVATTIHLYMKEIKA